MRHYIGPILSNPSKAPEFAEKRFQHYTWKHRIVACMSQKLFGGFTYTVSHGLLRGMRRTGGLGWLPAAICGDLETPEHRFLRTLDLRGLTVYDVGSYGIDDHVSAEFVRMLREDAEPLDRRLRRRYLAFPHLLLQALARRRGGSRLHARLHRGLLKDPNCEPSAHA